MTIDPKPIERSVPTPLSRREVYLKYLIGHRWSRFALSVFSLLAAIALHLSRLLGTEWTLWLIVGAALSLLYTFWIRVGEIFELLTDRGMQVSALDAIQFEKFLQQVELPPELVAAGYEIVHGGVGKNPLTGDTFQGVSATSPDVNRILWDRLYFDPNLPAECRYFFIGPAKKWKLPTQAQLLLHAILSIHCSNKNSVKTNDAKIRMRRDLVPDSACRELMIEKTDYISDLVTGQATGTRFQESAGHEIYGGFSFATDDDNGRKILKRMERSSCSNQLGASCLLILISKQILNDSTIRGQFIVGVQGDGNVQSAGLLAPSGSGSLDWNDFVNHHERLIEKGMLRELYEETTDGPLAKHLDSTNPTAILTGFARMIHRGGKPEFYGIAIASAEQYRLKIASSESKLTKKHIVVDVPGELNADNLRIAINNYANANKESVSHPLYMTIALASQFLDERKERFNALAAQFARTTIQSSHMQATN